MGRGWKGGAEAGQAAQPGKGDKAATCAPERPPNACGICAKAVAVQEEQHISGYCSVCGPIAYHTDCVQSHLERTLKSQIREGGYGTRAWEKVLMKIKQRPQDMFAQNGTSQRLNVSCPACQDGIVEAAEVVRPVRKLTLAPPLPAPRQRGPQAATGPSKNPNTVSASHSSAATKKDTQQKQLAAAMKQLASSKLGRGGSRPRNQPNAWPSSPSPGTNPNGGSTYIPNRPAWLQMCREVEEGGDCYTYRCPHCHSREEQQEREAEWAEEQAAKLRERRQEELEEFQRQQAEQAEAASAAAAARAEAAAAEARAQRERQAQVAREEATLQLSDNALALMKQHKRRQCIAALADMGFDSGVAAVAAEAAGCEPSAAASLLMEGGVEDGGSNPVSAVREARELLSSVAGLGLSPPAVEAALVVAGGDWEQARWELQQQAQAERQVAAATRQTVGISADATAAAAPPTPAAYGWGEAPASPPLIPLPWQADSPAMQGPGHERQASIPAWRPEGSGVAAQGGKGVGLTTHTPAATMLWPQDGAAAGPEISNSAESYEAGVAAGLLLTSSKAAPVAPSAAWQPANHQYEQQYSSGVGQYGGGVTWAPPRLDRPQPGGEEIEDLMHMLGIA